MRSETRCRAVFKHKRAHSWRISSQPHLTYERGLPPGVNDVYIPEIRHGTVARHGKPTPGAYEHRGFLGEDAPARTDPLYIH